MAGNVQGPMWHNAALGSSWIQRPAGDATSLLPKQNDPLDALGGTRRSLNPATPQRGIMPHWTLHIARHCWLSAMVGIYNVPPKSGKGRNFLAKFYLLRTYTV